jgi:hypothetical protein
MLLHKILALNPKPLPPILVSEHCRNKSIDDRHRVGERDHEEGQQEESQNPFNPHDVFVINAQNPSRDSRVSVANFEQDH